MKKIALFLMPVLALAMLFTGCDKNKVDPEEPVKSVGTFTQAAIVDAVAGMYAEWTETTTIPHELKVSNATLTLPQYQYAMARLMVDIRDGNAGDIEVLNFKPADHPERDSYDAETIAVYGGPSDGSNTEDLGNIAERMIAAMSEDGQVPNQTLFTRDGEAIAYSTNRATVTFARAISAYKEDGKMPESVTTDYLSAAATLKGFAQQFVTYLDVWENNIAETLSADGSHCSDNETAWENVHFIPIPYSGGYTDGVDQYDPKYQPYHTITVDGVTYSAAQCWGIALKGILDLVTVEGSAVLPAERNETVHTLGNGKPLTTPIPALEDFFEWGLYPWYEKADDPCVIRDDNGEIRSVGIDFLVKLIPWHLTRSSQLGAIGNFQTFGEDPASALVLPPYEGNISPMRELLIAARFYKYLLDNDINENVYDAMKDVMIDADLYGVDPDPLYVSETGLNFAYGQGEQTVKVTALSESWTATASADWVTVSPASGPASETSQDVTISVTANEGGSRTATVTFSIPSGTSKEVTVTQAPSPSTNTIRDFVTEYVKILDIWEETVGTVNYLDGIGATTNEANAPYDVENAHYVPMETTITVGDQTLGTADMFELAIRSYLLLRGYDGNSTTGGNGTFESVTPATLSSTLPDTHAYKWGSNPFNETGSTSAGNVTQGNGGELRMGDPNTADGVEAVKFDILDNFAQRSCNYPINNGSQISNMCGYAAGQLAGYYGCFCAQRGLITYAYFFKYMLDNNLEDLSTVQEDHVFETHLFK